ncbi:MAG: sulfite exporter TauE/SafE family protein [Rhodothermales bacterium]
MASGLALAGALHCAGMCGGFAVLARGGARSAGGGGGRFALYGAGKTLTYVVLGVVAGAAGAWLGGWSLGSRVLAVFVGVIMIGAGLQLGGWFALSGWFSGPRSVPLLGRVSARVADWLRSFMGQRSRFSLVGLGMVNGLLPCGLLYAALAGAAGTGGWWQGGAFMAIFGVGTLPALGLTAWFASRLSPRRRVLAARVGGVLLILFGVFTLFRGFPAMPGHSMH